MRSTSKSQRDEASEEMRNALHSRVVRRDTSGVSSLYSKHEPCKKHARREKDMHGGLIYRRKQAIECNRSCFLVSEEHKARQGKVMQCNAERSGSWNERQRGEAALDWSSHVCAAVKVQRGRGATDNSDAQKQQNETTPDDSSDKRKIDG